MIDLALSEAPPNGRADHPRRADDPRHHEPVLPDGPPDSIAGWKALADGLLIHKSCVFHRNLEISCRYAWIYTRLPARFKWAGMAAFASFHVRLALLPFRLDADSGTGVVDIPHSLGRRRERC